MSTSRSSGRRSCRCPRSRSRRTDFTPRDDRYSQIAVLTNPYSVPVRLVGKRVRVVLHASYLVVYDRNVEVARHERLIAMGG
ncbi:Mu transposase domain-containing protein [Streptomyces sp. col6]|uniref:Mu transposase domain-containing protein n=1 Tax=Streptomyces sp. col6 TaxID=2478958 RepID=UPI00398FEAF0